MTSNQNRSSRMVRNAVANGVLFSFIAIVSFFLSPFVVQHLGATQYGIWSLLASLVVYLGIPELGIRQAVSRYVAYHHAAGAHQESSSTVSAALKLFGCLGILAMFLSGIFAYFAPVWFNIPEALIDDTRTIVVLGGLTVAASMMGGVFGGVVSGLERFDINCCLEMLVTTVRTIGIVLALQAGHGLVPLACILLATSVFYWFVFWVAARKLYPELRLRLRDRLFTQMRIVLTFGVSVTAVFALTRLAASSNSVIIAAFLPIEAVTYFVIALSLCTYSIEAAKSLSYLMSPRVSALVSVRSDRVGEEVLRVAKISTLIVVPMAVTFLIRGESFITLWMGPEYGPASGLVLQVLAIVVWLEATRSVAIHSLMGMAKQRALILGFTAEAVCIVALSVALVGPLGIVGVALGTLIPSALVNMGYIPRCLSKAINFPAARFHREAVLLPSVACVPFALASAAVQAYVPTTNLAVFFVQVLAILPLVPLTAWFLCLTAGEKSLVGLEIRKVMGT